MFGAIIGDLAGSIYEFEQIKKITPIKVKNIIEKEAFISDDTILTIAIADAIIHNASYEEKLKEYVVKYGDNTPKNIPYFKTMFSPGFTKWAKSNTQGKSCGNGAMMRISPVGFLFDKEEDVITQTYLATIPSHNTTEAIECAKLVSLIIFYARHGLSKNDIIKRLNLKIKEPKINEFNYTCADTIDVCLYSLFKSNTFEDSIKLAISFGGDTDTNACIVGSMAEAIYGINEELKRKALSKLPSEFIEILNKSYERVNRFIQTI
ncbi:MAG: ADP-ribosylglycohydrolase family protein [Christensenellales bacterium]